MFEVFRLDPEDTWGGGGGTDAKVPLKVPRVVYKKCTYLHVSQCAKKYGQP